MQFEVYFSFSVEVRMLAILLPFLKPSTHFCVLMARRYPMSTSRVSFLSSSTFAAPPHCISILMELVSSISIRVHPHTQASGGLAGIAARVTPYLLFFVVFCRCVLAGVLLGHWDKASKLSLRYTWPFWSIFLGGVLLRICRGCG
jgi:hypothetical protein